MRKQFTPREYQNLIINHEMDLERCAVWASMGTGKTVSTLTALDILYLSGETRPTLVLAPLRVCNSTWPEEAQKWEHLRNIDVIPVTGAEKERLAALKRDASVYAVNYQNIPWLVEHYGAHWPFATVIADEATRLKSFRLRQGGVRAQSLAKVAHTKIKRFVNLTGTPAPNGLQDLWGMQWFIDKGESLGKTYTAFKDRYFRRTADGYGIELSYPTAAEHIYTRLRETCLTVDAKDWFDIKEPIVRNVEVDLPRAARQHYDTLKKELVVQIEQHSITAANAAVKTQKLLQIANGAAYTDPAVEEDEDPRARHYKVLHDAKIEALESIIEESAGMPVLVAYNFRSDLERLLKAFKKAVVLDDNPETLKLWNKGRIPVLLAHPACLHPSTEVLTEFRGWVKITSVLTNERVFDGLEFVTHSGCQYSGFHEVIECFGVTMTPEHKILIQDIWTEAKHVRDSENNRREARYCYKGDDEYLSKMLALRAGIGNTQTECRKTQSQRLNALPEMRKRTIPLPDRDSDMEFLERFAFSFKKLIGQRLRRAWYKPLSRMGRIFELLPRYVAELFRGSNDRTNRREPGLLQRELYLGEHACAAIKQAHYATFALQGGGYSPRGISAANRFESMYPHMSIEPGADSGRSGSRCASVDVSEEQKKAHVYDLVDCGPRNRFLIRNSKGEVFVSHNSAGHGLNLQDGGNILVFFGHNWNLEDRLQIIERIGPVRQMQAGYDRPVFIYNIIARNTVDRLVMDRVESKKTVQEILMENMKRL